MPLDLPSPPQANRSTKGEPPVRSAVRDNLSKPEPSSSVALNFRVPASFRKDFKLAACEYGIPQSTLLQRMFEEFMARRG